MGRLSDYDIWPKPKVWAGSLSADHSAELPPTVVFQDETTCFTGERTEWLENVVVNKHVNTQASSEMANYGEKLHRIVY